MRREIVEVLQRHTASGLGRPVRQAMLVAPHLCNISGFLMTVRD